MFDLEVDIWEDILRAINGIIFAKTVRDRVIWDVSSSNRFSFRSFMRSITRGEGGYISDM